MRKLRVLHLAIAVLGLLAWLVAAPQDASSSEGLARLGSFFSWSETDVIGLDDYDVSKRTWEFAAPNDIIAVYWRLSEERMEFRIDFLDLPATGAGDIDVRVEIEVPAASEDLTINFEIPAQGPATLTCASRTVSDLRVDRDVDALAFALPVEILDELHWTKGYDIRVRVTAVDAASQHGQDQTNWFSSRSAGIKPVPFIYAPFWALAGDSLGHSSMKYFLTDSATGYLPLLQTCEHYEQPIAPAFTEGLLAAADLEGMLDYLVEMQARGLLEVSGFAGSGFPLTWYSSSVTSKAIAQTASIFRRFGIDWGPAFVPYDDVMKAKDFEVIKDAGFTIIPVGAFNSYYYWFGEEPERSSHPAFELHRANGLNIAFWTGCIGCAQFREAYPPPGTRKALFRHVLNQSAQYQSIVVYADDGWQIAEIWPELYPGIGVKDFEEFVRWIAAHPWIEMTTFSGLLAMDLDAHDVGSISPIDEFHYMPADTSYRAYHDLSYCGGSADGHSPTVPAREHIEGYAEYVPVLDHGTPIPSLMSMGDDRTPGTLVYSVVDGLRHAPDNSLTELGWFAFFRCSQAIAERADESGAIGGPYLPEGTKAAANLTGQVGKIIYASEWAAQAEGVAMPTGTQVLSIDADFDGELELILLNQNMLAMFENDGGRMDFLFARDGEGFYPLVFPAWLLNGARFSQAKASEGEAAIFGWRGGEWEGRDLMFAEKGREYELYSMRADGDSIVATSPDGRVKKTFTLADGSTSLRVDYQADRTEQIHLALCVNPFSVFAPDIRDRWGVASTARGFSVWNTDGGFAAVGADSGLISSFSSFTDAGGNYIPYVSATYSRRGSFSFGLETSDDEWTDASRKPVPTQVRICARGEAYQGVWPILSVKSDCGEDWEVRVANSELNDYEHVFSLAPGEHEFCLKFLNDAAGPGGDRNVFLDYVEIGGTHYELEDVDYSVHAYEVLETDGEVRFYYGATICFAVLIPD